MNLQRSKREKETRSLKKISDSCVEGAPCYTHLDSKPFRITIASVYDWNTIKDCCVHAILRLRPFNDVVQPGAVDLRYCDVLGL